MSGTWLTEEGGGGGGQATQEERAWQVREDSCWLANRTMKTKRFFEFFLFYLVHPQSRCVELEDSLGRFRDQATRIREVLKEKVGKVGKLRYTNTHKNWVFLLLPSTS